MYPTLIKTIESLPQITPSSTERHRELNRLVQYIRSRVLAHQGVQLNFICTHNSRRSHLSQVWAHAIARYFQLKTVHCYSGGTEATALYPKVAETLKRSGFVIEKTTDSTNPLYSIHYTPEATPISAFSKKFNHTENPSSGFAAVLTCSHADEHCPIVPGAEQRIVLPYDDPKASDGTPEQDQVYWERSLEIAAELYFVFSQINTTS